MGRSLRHAHMMHEQKILNIEAQTFARISRGGEALFSEIESRLEARVNFGGNNGHLIFQKPVRAAFDWFKAENLKHGDPEPQRSQNITCPDSFDAAAKYRVQNYWFPCSSEASCSAVFAGSLFLDSHKCCCFLDPAPRRQNTTNWRLGQHIRCSACDRTYRHILKRHEIQT